MGPQGTTKGNAQLSTQNDFSFTQTKLVWYLIKKHLRVTIWFRKFVCFFKKRHHIATIAWCWIPRDASSIFLATIFTRKVPRSSDSMYSFYFLLENIWHPYFTWSRPNSQEIMNFAPIVGSRGPELNWNKFKISCEFDPLDIRWWYHMFSSIKMEEYMEPELSGFFLSKNWRQKYSAWVSRDPFYAYVG